MKAAALLATGLMLAGTPAHHELGQPLPPPVVDRNGGVGDLIASVRSRQAPQGGPSLPALGGTLSSYEPGWPWDALAQCESGGDWSINTGNGLYGAFQFSIPSWEGVGGSGLPSNASPQEQVMRAKRLQQLQGWAAWPVCSVKVGLR